VESLLDPRFEESIDSYYAAIATQRLDDWLATLSAGVVVHEPAGSLPAEGHTGASEAWKVLTAPFRALTFERTKSFPSGSGVAVLWRCHALGVNGGSAGAEGISVFEFDGDGLIETVVSYWDPAALLIDLADADDEALH
jgi:ketosteroid isomerase-like protein